MKQFIRDYLTFNKRERNGLFVLLSIITILFVYLNISRFFIKPEVIDFTQFEKDIEQFNTYQERTPLLWRGAGGEANEDEGKLETFNVKEEYFIFNPNNLSSADWKRLGFSDKQIKVIKNYESKGGKFNNKNDLKKMYCISEKQYLSLEPFIQIPDAKKEFVNFESAKSISKNVLVEINSADSAQLVSLNGIGGFYAKAIIKYKEQLGGYYEKEQLLEIWKFDENKLKNIANKINVDTTIIKKININICEAKQLKHPYLKWNQVNAIINYRIKHGKYLSIDQIKKTDLVDELTYRKIAPYLTVK